MLTISRRNLLRNTGIVGIGLLFANTAMAASNRSITMPSAGGTWDDAYKEVVSDPFTKKTGIQIIKSGAPDFARMKAQVISGNPEWDICDFAGSWMAIASKQNLLETLDVDLLGGPSSVKMSPKNDFLRGIGFASAITWNSKRVSREKAPTSFEQLWDTKAFPGPRAFLARVDWVLEMALVADGVKPSELYPLDVDRGFKSLERIRPHVAKWCKTVSELTTLVASGEAEYSVNPTSRTKAALQGGLPIATNLNQTIIAGDYVGIPKGSQNVDVATKLIAFYMTKEVQAAFCSKLAFVPGNPQAADLVNPDVKNWLPDESTGNHIVQDSTWWAENLEATNDRFTEFLLG